jgi:myo-inositol-1(or 4)-monophosphatase
MEDWVMTVVDHLIGPSAIERRADFCVELAESAGALALEGFLRQKDKVPGLKGPQDFLTETDEAVERHIRGRLADAFPDDGFLGEETGWSAGRNAIWVVDPIDGTANFARSIPHFCVAIALVANGEVQCGAIVNPAVDDLYFARKDEGAQRNGEAIHVSPTTDIRATSFELGWSNRVPQARYINALTALLDAGSNVRRAASGALALAYVADGRSDGYAELHMNAWDCLAGLLLVREAGGVTGPFLSRGGLRNGGAVLAATPAVAPVLSAATAIPIVMEADRSTGL